MLMTEPQKKPAYCFSMHKNGVGPTHF